MTHNRKRRMLRAISTLFLAALTLPVGILASAQDATSPNPHIVVTVQDITTGKPIHQGETIVAGDQFQATVTVLNNVDCAGQLVLTALGAPGNPPSVIVQSFLFIIGPASGGDSATGGILTSNGTPGHPNDWKVSASCNAAMPGSAFGFAQFHFTSAVPD
jgi:hypothetical protein